jgi:hypothetical protein
MRITESLLIFAFVILLAAQVSAQCKDEGCGLVIRGQVTDIKSDTSEKNSVRFKLNLDVEFFNGSDEPIILFKPYRDNYWLGGWFLYYIDENTKSRKTLLKNGLWESVAGTKEYRILAEKLDVKTPPSEYTKILQPKESLKFKDSLQFWFDSTGPKYTCCMAWDEVQTLPSKKFQLQISYELNPWNIEYFKPKLIRKLHKRWKNHGNVLVKEKKGLSNHFVYSSEPMLIDFSQVREKQVKAINE